MHTVSPFAPVHEYVFPVSHVFCTLKPALVHLSLNTVPKKGMTSVEKPMLKEVDFVSPTEQLGVAPQLMFSWTRRVSLGCALNWFDCYVLLTEICLCR